MVRFIVCALGVWLFAAAGQAADLAPEIGLKQLPVLAQVLQEGVVDVDKAVVEPPDLCDKNATFVDSLKAQILLQIFGNFTLERVVSDLQGAASLPYPTPFNDTQGDVGLKDLLRMPRRAEGNDEVVREALETIRASLLAAGPTPR